MYYSSAPATRQAGQLKHNKDHRVPYITEQRSSVFWLLLLFIFTAKLLVVPHNVTFEFTGVFHFLSGIGHDCFRRPVIE
jgi:hypothetical protein